MFVIIKKNENSIIYAILSHTSINSVYSHYIYADLHYSLILSLIFSKLFVFNL